MGCRAKWSLRRSSTWNRRNRNRREGGGDCCRFQRQVGRGNPLNPLLASLASSCAAVNPVHVPNVPGGRWPPGVALVDQALKSTSPNQTYASRP